MVYTLLGLLHAAEVIGPFNAAALVFVCGIFLFEGIRYLICRKNPQTHIKTPPDKSAALWLTPRREMGLIIALTLLAAAVRFYRLANYPAGLHYDEASIAYDAACLARYGTDRLGYHNPVYLVAWGSGQNAAYLYTLAPLIRLFGVSTFVIRLPQAVLGTLVVPCVWLLLRRTNRQTALVAAALFTISPWHVMASRWGLEVYPAVLFMLCGLLCWRFAMAGKRAWMLVPAFCLWAATLYWYISIALFLAVFLALLFALCLYYKKIHLRWFFIGVAAGLLVALPLMLFIAVNNNWLPEIRTALISIPKLERWRQGEIGRDMLGNASALVTLLFRQSPSWEYSFYDHFPGFGVVYLFSLPFMLAGVIDCARALLFAVRQKEKALPESAVWLAWLLAAFVYSLLVFANTLNRAMPLCIAMIAFTARGIAFVIRRPLFKATTLLLFITSFILFLGCFFVDYAPNVSTALSAELPEAYQAADAVSAGRQVLVTHYAGEFGAANSYPYICLNRGTTPAEYQSQYETHPNPAYPPKTVNFDNVYIFREPFEGVAPYGAEKVYILSNVADPVQQYEDAGFTIQRFTHHSVAYIPS